MASTPVERLAHDAQVVLGLQDQAQAGADHGLVVDEQQPDHRCTSGGHGTRASTGMLACTRQPGPGWRGPAVSAAADGGEAFGHADEAVAATGAPDGGCAGTLVVDEQSHGLGGVDELHVDHGVTGIAHGVGERLLDDAVEDELDAGRHRWAGRRGRRTGRRGRRRVGC